MVDREKIIEIFKSSPAPTSIVKTDAPDFTILQVNDAYKNMTQRDENEILGKSLFESFPENPEEEKPTGVEKLKCSFQKVIESKEPDEMDAIRYDIVLDDGQYKKVYWRVINTPVLDDNGQVEFIINSANNITEQVLSERANKLMMNNSEDSFILIDKQLIIQSYNDSFAKNYQEIFDAVVKKGESILKYAQPERREAVKEIYARVFEGETIEKELPFKTPTGQTRYFNIKYKPAEDENGNIIGSFISLLEKTDEYTAKLELEKKEARFRALVENGGDVVFILSPEGEPTYISPSIKNVLGYSLEEAQKMDLFDKTHPDDVDHIKKELAECLEKPGEPLNVTPARMKHKDGSWRWFEGTITNMIDDPAVGGIVDNFHDITERVKADQRIAEAKEQYQSLIQTIDGIVWEADAENFVFNYVSPQSEKVLGYKPSEWVGVPGFWKDKIHPDDRSEAVEFCHHQTQKGQNHSFEYRIKKSSGKYVWIRDIVTVVTDNGKPALLRGLMMDITQIKEAQKQLQQTKEKYRNVVEHSTNMFYQHDTKGVLTYLSPQSKDFLGCPPEEALINWTAFITNHPANKKGEELTQKAIETGKPQPPYELQLKRDDGEIIWVEIHETPVKENGEVVGIAGSLTDITARKQYEEQLQESLERYDYVSKATRDAIYDWDINENHLHWGEGLENLFGHHLPEETFPIEKWAELIHPNDVQVTKKDLESALQDSSQNSWTYEYRFLKSDGSYTYVVESGYIIRDEDKNPVRMIGALRDITESKQIDIQNKLQQDVAQYFKKEDPLSSILENVLKHLSNYGEFSIAEIWLTNHDKSHLNRISAYGKDKAGKNFYKYTNHINQFAFGEGLAGTIWENQSILNWKIDEEDSLFVRKDAAHKAGLESAFGLPLLHNDELIGVLLLGSKKSAEANKSDIYLYEALQTFMGGEIKRKQQEEEMRLLFESAPEILAVASPNGYFSKVNPAFCELMGYTEEELTSEPFENFLHPDDLESTITEYSETITGERQADNFVNRYKTKSGEYRWISWNSSDVFGEDDFVFAFGRDVTATKELEQLLSEVQHMAKIGAWEVELKNETVYWSSITKKIHEVEPGYKPDLEAGIDFFKEGESRETIKKVLEKALKNGESWDEEVQIVTAKGNEKWIRTKGLPEIVNGECRRIYGSFQDINDRKEAEIKLAESFKEKENILESIGDGFFTVNKDWTVTYWNRAAERMLHTPKQKILNQNLWDVFDNAIDLPSYTNYHRAMHQSITVDFEDYYPELEKWFDISAYPSPNGISVFFKDITERKTSEEKIKRINERFEKVTEATNDAIWDFNITDNKLFWGKGFEKLFGYDLEKIEPSFDFLLSLIHPDDRERVSQNIERYMTDQSKVNWTEEYRFLKNDGTYAYVMDRAIFINNKNGNVIRVVGAMTDLTSQKKYEESLRKLNKELEERAQELSASNAELEQFAYVASHDLQEPLRMVSSFLTQLDKKYSDVLDDKAKEYINFAVDGAQRMRQIILDLLDYSRLNQDKNKREKVDLNNILEEVQSLERSLIEEKNAKIKIQKLPIIVANPGPIKQVFKNLLNNALKYCTPGTAPKIDIKTEMLDTHWKFSIKDNGIGINPEFQETIFQIFQRLHTRDQYSGTGIGLAISKKIIERHGGEIWVESEEGKGSTFHFTIEK